MTTNNVSVASAASTAATALTKEIQSPSASPAAGQTQQQAETDAEAQILENDFKSTGQTYTPAAFQDYLNQVKSSMGGSASSLPDAAVTEAEGALSQPGATPSSPTSSHETSGQWEEKQMYSATSTSNYYGAYNPLNSNNKNGQTGPTSPGASPGASPTTSPTTTHR